VTLSQKRVSMERKGHTRKDPSKGAWGDEHPIGSPWRDLTRPTVTRVFPN